MDTYTIIQAYKIPKHKKTYNYNLLDIHGKTSTLQFFFLDEVPYMIFGLSLCLTTLCLLKPGYGNWYNAKYKIHSFLSQCIYITQDVRMTEKC